MEQYLGGAPGDRGFFAYTDIIAAMPRTREPAGRREMISVRVSEATAAAVDKARGSASRSAWVEGLITSELDKDVDPVTVRETGNCPHPRGRVIKGFCYRCGSMVSK